MTELPEPLPLTPATCDLRDYPSMMMDVVRLFSSTFHARANDSEWRAGVTLWLKAFHQVPAGSFADDEIELTRAAELGRDFKTFRKLRPMALHGWVKCSDGRLYHPVVSEKALEAWIDRLTQRKVSQAGNAKRHNIPFDPAEVDMEIERACGMLELLNPNSRALTKRVRKSKPTDTGSGGSSPPTGPKIGAKNLPSGGENDPNGRNRNLEISPDGTPVDLPSGSQAKLSEAKERKKEPETTSLATAAAAPPLRADVRTEVWRDGLDILRRLTGKADGTSRAFLGRLLKAAGDDCDAILQILHEAESLRPVDPEGWLTQAAKSRSRRAETGISARKERILKAGGLWPTDDSTTIDHDPNPRELLQ
jgi:hypothetical protein